MPPSCRAYRARYLTLTWFGASCVLLCLAVPSRADNVAKRTYQVPYRLGNTNHVIVRAKINGKGPYYFIIDTGAPALFVSTASAHAVGATADKDGWATLDRFEIEGGAIVNKARGRIADPFQLEGMNALGLAGVHLDGIIGYNLLARYRLEFDFSHAKMTWTALDFEPPQPPGLRGQKGNPAQLDALGSILKILAAFLGKKAPAEVRLRGFLGMELADRDGMVAIKAVLPHGPSAAAGLKAGDRIRRFNGKAVKSSADVEHLAKTVKAGETVRLTLAGEREGEPITVKAGEGF